MSTTQQTPAATAPAVPDGQAAYNLLQQHIFYPAFLQKVAAAGITLTTQADQLAAIHEGESLLRLWEAQQAKEAAAGDPVLARMAQANQQALQYAGLVNPQAQMQLQKNAYAFAENPHIAAAALTLELLARDRQPSQQPAA